jgi:hypothetical protein
MGGGVFMRWDWWSSSEFVGSLHLCWIAVCNADECTFAWRLQKKKRNNRVLLSAMGLLLLIGCNTGASVVETVHCWCQRWLKIYDWRRYLIHEISSIGIQCWNTEVQIWFWSFMKNQNKNMPFRFWAISSCMLVIEERKGKICRLWNSCWGCFLFRTV